MVFRPKAASKRYFQTRRHAFLRLDFGLGVYGYTVALCSNLDALVRSIYRITAGRVWLEYDSPIFGLRVNTS